MGLIPPCCDGLSVHQHPIPAWWIGAETGPITYLIGAFHGDEPEAAELVLDFLEKHHATPNLKRTLVIPVFNPDGLQNNTRTNANGVDLNRNWPTANWTDPSSEDKYYGGPNPLSEPETQWLHQLMTKHPPALVISVHTPYREINIDGPARPIAEQMARHNRYPITEDIGYPTPGSFGTYWGKEGDIPVITLELPDWNEKQQPYAQTWTENEPALLHVLEHTHR